VEILKGTRSRPRRFAAGGFSAALRAGDSAEMRKELLPTAPQARRELHRGRINSLRPRAENGLP
jgi:hypothetical protein